MRLQFVSWLTMRCEARVLVNHALTVRVLLSNRFKFRLSNMRFRIVLLGVLPLGPEGFVFKYVLPSWSEVLNPT